MVVNGLLTLHLQLYSATVTVSRLLTLHALANGPNILYVVACQSLRGALSACQQVGMVLICTEATAS